MPLYEHVYLARQDVSQQQVEAVTADMRQVVEERGGIFTKVEYWGVKSLTYKIKKNRKAHFTLINIDASADALSEMERRMGLSTDIIRFMTIRVDTHETEQSVQMRKGDREERRGNSSNYRGSQRLDKSDKGDRVHRGERGNRDGSTFRARPQYGDQHSQES
ncbi:MAG: 30S ribosomal protein S6 [Hyphomicrobiaceae bacterium]|nr:30S ribosomal protein S6 [Hyphomicrobiaceae bacterium]